MFSTKLDYYFNRHFFSFFAIIIIVNRIDIIVKIVINIKYSGIVDEDFSFVTIAIGVFSSFRGFSIMFVISSVIGRLLISSFFKSEFDISSKVV